MAMLAEPRRKQKVVNLRAKNSAWSNDTQKFGQRMLERMGWSSGKGLGAREDGAVEHVIARYKNDECGLGYEDKSDQWTQHEDDYSALLAGLSSGGSVEAEPAAITLSLEARSKRSRARVHYHKFTRGKDLSRYSQKDLANIFGKKTLEKTSAPLEEPQEERAQSSALFRRGGDMIDYFSKKLKTLGSGALHNANSEREENNLNCLKKKKKSEQRYENEMQQHMNAEASTEDSDKLIQKSRKNKKNTREVTIADHDKANDASRDEESRSLVSTDILESLENDSKAAKKKKKAKGITALSEHNVVEEKSEQPATDDSGGTKKKSKRKPEQVEDVLQTLEEKDKEERPQKKKKKKDKIKYL